MPRIYFEIHTEETVHGVYAVMAKSKEEALSRFERGNVPKPLLYEAEGATVTRVVERNMDEQ